MRQIYLTFAITCSKESSDTCGYCDLGDFLQNVSNRKFDLNPGPQIDAALSLVVGRNPAPLQLRPANRAKIVPDEYWIDPNLWVTVMWPSPSRIVAIPQLRPLRGPSGSIVEVT